MTGGILSCGVEPGKSPLVVGNDLRICWVAQDPERYFEAANEDGDPANSPRDSQGGWKIVTPSEVRNGFLLPFGHKLRTGLKIVGPVKMRCELARPPGADIPVSVRVVLTDVQGQVRPVKTVELDGSQGTWTEWEIDLSGFEDTTMELSIVARVAGAKQPDWPVLVSNPEFLRVDRRSTSPDILLISVDTLRADRMSLFGYDRPTTPKIDRWAREAGVVFSDVIAGAPWTLPAHVSLFTALDAARHGVNHDVGGLTVQAGVAPVVDLEFMAETLRLKGYSTAAFTGGAYVGPEFGFAQGFDIFSSWPDRGRDSAELPTGVERTLEFFKSRGNEPAFVFLHTYAVHDPYRTWPGFFEGGGTKARIALKSPKNSVELGFRQVNRLVFRPSKGGQRPVTADELDLANRMYDSGVSFVDDQLGRLFKELKSQGLDRNLIVVLTSDHGESLGEGGRFGHVDLTDEVLRIPLVFVFPENRGAGTTINQQVRQVDIWPTVAEVVGVPLMPGWDGLSLNPLIDGTTWNGPGEAWAYSAAPNRGIGLRLEGHTKVIFDNNAWRIPGPRRFLFDLKSDRSEIRNLADTDPGTKALMARVEEYLNQRASGLRLQFRNRSEADMVGTVKGAMVRPVGTKILTPGGPGLNWKEMGSAEFVIPPGSNVTFSFEKVFGRKLSISGSLGEAPFEFSFDVRSLGKSSGWSLDGTQWVPEAQEDSRTSIRVWWHGIETFLGEGPVSHTSDVVEQLRALGYVD